MIQACQILFNVIVDYCLAWKFVVLMFGKFIPHVKTTHFQARTVNLLEKISAFWQDRKIKFMRKIALRKKTLKIIFIKQFKIGRC